MKKLLLLFFVSFALVFGVTAQSKSKTKKTTQINKKPSLAQQMLADVKKLTKEQKDIYLTTLKKIDAADAEFAINKNALTFFSNMEKAENYFLENTSKLPEDMLSAGFGLLMLNYIDASVLIKLGAIRSTEKTINFSEKETEALGEMFKRYKDLNLVSDLDDLLDEDTVSKIYASAISLKNGMYSYFEK